MTDENRSWDGFCPAPSLAPMRLGAHFARGALRGASGIVLAVVLSACTASTSPQEGGRGPDASVVQMRRLPDSTVALFVQHSGLREPQRRLVRTADEWTQLWQVFREYTGAGALRTPAVDFSRDLVVVVGSGEKQTSGFRVVIDSIRPDPEQGRAAGALLVYAREEEPGRCQVGQLVTAPADLVLVPRSAVSEAPESVRFVLRTVVRCP